MVWCVWFVGFGWLYKKIFSLWISRQFLFVVIFFLFFIFRFTKGEGKNVEEGECD